MAESKTVQKVQKAIESAPERKFMETVDLAINLKDIDLSIPKNRIAEEIVLPKGRGKTVKVAVIASQEMAAKAKPVADLVILQDQLDDMADDKRESRKVANNMDFFVAEAPLMPLIGKRLGIFLGPRGKMPKPIPPGADPASIINTLRNSVRVRSKDKMTFHVPVGTMEMSAEDIGANIDDVLKRVLTRLERGKQNISSVYVKTTMGPSVKLM
ncbi:MAG: 50S ribosomal protein L1 [Thermoplasmata archaeon]|nr:50S ribosomal protein L1 [Thermoplasmata archaeon]